MIEDLDSDPKLKSQIFELMDIFKLDSTNLIWSNILWLFPKFDT